MRILLAEDEKSLSRALTAILEHNGYSVDAVYNGMDVLDYLQNEVYDGLILDLMMPKMDGLTALRRIRESGNSIPVLILTARSEIDDKVEGLDCGANDYLTKPFDSRELLARLRAITRSRTAAVNSMLSFGNVFLNQATHELSSPSGKLPLANKEFQIMELLLCNPGNVIATERLFEKVWGYDSSSEINVVWVYISYLRKKLTALQANVQIRAMRGTGYYLEVCS